MINGSGFNDAIFQANLCSTESLASAISGSHYNRCWRIHEPFVEALERLLMEKFVDDSQLAIPDKVISLTESLGVENDEETIKDEAILQFYKEYLSFRERCRSGDFGKTTQVWVALYLDIVEVLHMIHTAVQTNDFDL